MVDLNVKGAPVGGGKLVGGGGSPKADFTSRISSANELSFSKVEWVAGQALLPGHQPHALVEVDVARGGKDALKIRYDGETNTWSSVRPLKDGGEFSRVLTPSERDAFAKLIDGYQKVQSKRKGGTTKPLHEVATQRLAAALASDRPLGRTEFNSLKTAAGITWAAPLGGQAAVAKAEEKGPAKKENGQGKATPPAVDALKVSERQQTVLKLLEKEYDFLANVKPSDYTERLQGTTSNFLKNVEKDVKGMKGDAQQLLGKIIMLHAQKSAPTVLSAEQVTLAGMLMGRVSELEKLTGQQYSSSLSSVTDGLLSKAHSKLAGTNLSSVNEAIKSLEELHKKLLAERLKHKEAKSTPVAATTQAPAFIGPPFEPK
ncbi:MAG: hypothetical protein K1X64_03945, partial [Myxococcaceae bacterium]|nr:hypothetical protein [Myxococcaceae bacterium]